MNHRPVSWFNQRLVLGSRQRIREQRRAERDPPRSLVLLRHRCGLRVQERAHARQRAYSRRATSATSSCPSQSTIRSTTSLGGDIIKRDGKYVNGFGADFAGPGRDIAVIDDRAPGDEETDTLDNTVGVFAQEESRGVTACSSPAACGSTTTARSAASSATCTIRRSAEPGSSARSRSSIFRRVTTLKLRAAYGESGQAPLPYSSNATFTAVPGPFGAVGDSAQDSEIRISVRSADTRRSSASMRDCSTIAPASSSRTTSVERRTRFCEQQVAPSIGYPGTQFVNAGALTKHGFELALHGTPYQTQEHRMDARPQHRDGRQQGRRI